MNARYERLKAPLRPLVRRWRAWRYDLRFRRRLRRVTASTERPVRTATDVTLDADPEALWSRVRPPSSIPTRDIFLEDPVIRQSFDAYWHRFADRYDGVGREKALEHALTFTLIDFSRVRRYCDVASASSPLHDIVPLLHPGVEFWKQDLLYPTDLSQRTIGGFAQTMQGVPDGFFDAMTLHCSYEHFAGRGDIDFLTEVGRVLGDPGTCLIVPLYLADTHRVYFDPTVADPGEVPGYDPEGDLIAVRGYRQAHGRAHSPESLVTRLLPALPSSLRATLLRFRGQTEGIYLEFGMVLGRGLGA